jgi:hypothetical protein
MCRLWYKELTWMERLEFREGTGDKLNRFEPEKRMLGNG